MDPLTPGAVDGIVNLGEFLAEREMAPAKAEIRQVMGEISRRFARAYRYLAAAAPLLEEAQGIYAAALRPESSRRLEAQWIQDLGADTLAPQAGRVRPLFASAVSPAGLVHTLDALGAQEYWRIVTPWGADTSAILERLGQALSESGQDAEHLMNPLRPQRVEHLYLPGRRLLITTQTPDHAVEGALFSRTLDFLELTRPAAWQAQEDTLRDTRRLFRLLLDGAVDALREAKALHDQLESFYVGSMDFAAVESRLRTLLNEA